MYKNLIPLPYRHVSVQRVPIPLDEPAIRSYLLGKEAYRRTDYIVLRGEDGLAVVRVEKAGPALSPSTTLPPDGAQDERRSSEQISGQHLAEGTEPLFSPITAVEVLALPDNCVWVEDPEVDTGNPSAMAAKAHSLTLSPQATLIVEGLYGHVNFLHHPEPLVIRVVEVVPPHPPKLLAMARKVLSYADDLPPMVLKPELVDLSAKARDHPAAAYLFPCRASGLVGPGPTYYLDERPHREDWLLIGCERSRQIHRHFYGDEPPCLEMCPRSLMEPGGVLSPATELRIGLSKGSEPTLLKCCLLESEIEMQDRTVVVPWGATLQQVEQGLRALMARWLDGLRSIDG
ncbi:MAG: hypothetical protein ACE5I2_05685 [Anaerolineae bacterium]